MKFGRNVLQVNARRLTESDFWCNVILSRWRSWCQVKSSRYSQKSL